MVGIPSTLKYCWNHSKAQARTESVSSTCRCTLCTPAYGDSHACFTWNPRTSFGNQLQTRLFVYPHLLTLGLLLYSEAEERRRYKGAVRSINEGPSEDPEPPQSPFKTLAIAIHPTFVKPSTVVMRLVIYLSVFNQWTPGRHVSQIFDASNDKFHSGSPGFSITSSPPLASRGSPVQDRSFSLPKVHSSPKYREGWRNRRWLQNCLCSNSWGLWSCLRKYLEDWFRWVQLYLLRFRYGWWNRFFQWIKKLY